MSELRVPALNATARRHTRLRADGRGPGGGGRGAEAAGDCRHRWADQCDAAHAPGAADVRPGDPRAPRQRLAGAEQINVRPLLRTRRAVSFGALEHMISKDISDLAAVRRFIGAQCAQAISSTFQLAGSAKRLVTGAPGSRPPLGALRTRNAQGGKMEYQATRA